MLLRSSDVGGDVRNYAIVGQVFFASSEAFVRAFDFKDAVRQVRIDLTHAHFWDITAVSALDKVVMKFKREGIPVEVIGLNEASATIMDRLALHNEPDARERVLGH